MTDKLTELRMEIDQIDQSIVELLKQRAEVALRVGEYKKERGMRLYVPEREKQVIKRLERLNRGQFPLPALKHIYNQIIATCLNLEKALQIAYLGPEATFTHSAALNRFGRTAEFVSHETVDEVFEAVERREVDFGVVPIENSQEGAVRHTLDRFLESDLVISSESYLEVELCLLGKMPRLEDIEVLCSHRQAFSQAKKWIEKNLPGVSTRETNSTAAAASRAAEQPAIAAVASPVAAEIYGLEILAHQIEDRIDNFTRFLVIGRDLPEPTGDDKTSIAFSLKDRAGALYKTLQPFGEMNINMTKIESRPAQSRTWDYIFFVDFIGHQQEEKVRDLLEKLKTTSAFFQILGSYPREEPFNE